MTVQYQCHNTETRSCYNCEAIFVYTSTLNDERETTAFFVCVFVGADRFLLLT